MNALALLLCLLGPVWPRQVDAWAQIWTELETLRDGKLSPAEVDMLRSHLDGVLQKQAVGPRAELLGAAMVSFSGRNVGQVAERLAALEPRPFSARELWILADLMPSGAARARVVLEALAAPTPLSDWQALLAWNAAVDEARALRLDELALPIQLRLHERYKAPWSAEDLALTYKALGRGKAADQVLECHGMLLTFRRCQAVRDDQQASDADQQHDQNSAQ